MKRRVEETTLMNRIAGGDQDAFEECIERYGNLVWSLARRFTPKTEDAEDAVQEIMTAIWQNARRYDSKKAAEATFISTIARRRLIDRLRKVYRRPAIVSIDETAEIPKEGFADRVLDRIEAERAFRAMRALRPDQRNLIMMNIYDGLSHGEIGESLGLPLGTVKTHIRRGFERVRRSMAVAAGA